VLRSIQFHQRILTRRGAADDQNQAGFHGRIGRRRRAGVGIEGERSVVDFHTAALMLLRTADIESAAAVQREEGAVGCHAAAED
jgi:hypothetical protein